MQTKREAGAERVKIREAPAPFWVGRNFGAFSLTAHRKCPYNKKSEKSKSEPGNQNEKVPG